MTYLLTTAVGCDHHIPERDSGWTLRAGLSVGQWNITTHSALNHLFGSFPFSSLKCLQCHFCAEAEEKIEEPPRSPAAVPVRRSPRTKPITEEETNGNLSVCHKMPFAASCSDLLSTSAVDGLKFQGEPSDSLLGTLPTSRARLQSKPSFRS